MRDEEKYDVFVEPGKDFPQDVHTAIRRRVCR